MKIPPRPGQAPSKPESSGIRIRALSVLVVEDEVPLQHAYARALRACDMRFVGTLQEAREALEARRFDVAIIDLGLPDGSGSELLPLLENSSTRAFVVSGNVLVGVPDGVKVWAKPVPFAALLAALDLPVTEVEEIVLELALDRRAKSIAHAELTTAERQVASLAVRGLSRIEMADELNIHPRTLDKHLQQVRTKLAVPSIQRLTWLVGRRALRGRVG